MFFSWLQNYIKFQRKKNVNPVSESYSPRIHVTFFFFLNFFLFFKIAISSILPLLNQNPDHRHPSQMKLTEMHQDR